MNIPAASSRRSTIGRLQRWSARCVLTALLAAAAATFPYAKTSTVAMPSFFPMYVATMIVVNLLLATLLLIKGTSDKNHGTIRLGAAYLFVFLMNVLHALSFPGGVMPTPLIGTSQTSAWVWCSWHMGFGLGVMQYSHLADRTATRSTSAARSVLITVTLAGCIAFVATSCTDRLPTLLRGGEFIYSFPAVLPWAAAAVCTFSALASLVRRRARTPEHLWLTVGVVASCIDVCLTTCGSARYSFGWYIGKCSSLFASLSVLISFIYDITCVYTEVAANNRTLQTLANVDGLTGIANRRRFDEMLGDEFARAGRLNLPLALLLFDIDGFKSYNDTYGHPAGDECLRRVSDAIKSALWRSGDQVARYGGEEIAVLLPSVDLDGARMIAERIRLAVAALGIEHPASSHQIITVSAGATAFIPSRRDETPADLVKSADIALYEAKQSGRNRVCVKLPDELVAAKRDPSFLAGVGDGSRFAHPS